ncbi:MAG: hypothetical protein WDW38_007279 [Sanguina aurantia]
MGGEDGLRMPCSGLLSAAAAAASLRENPSTPAAPDLLAGQETPPLTTTGNNITVSLSSTDATDPAHDVSTPSPSMPTPPPPSPAQQPRKQLSAAQLLTALPQLSSLWQSSPKDESHSAALADLMPAVTDLILKHMPTFEAKHLRTMPTLIVTLSSLSYCSPELVLKVAEVVKPHLDKVPAGEVAEMLAAFSTIHTRPSPAWLGSCMATLQPRLSTLRGPQLVTALWALSRLGVKPTSSWLGEFLRCCKGEMHGLGARDVSRLAWACAEIQLQPGEEWTQLAQLSESQRILTLLESHEMSDLAHGLLHLKPAAQPAVDRQDAAGMSVGDEGGVTCVIYAVTVVTLTPAAQPLCVYTYRRTPLQVVNRQLSAYRPSDLTTVVSCCVGLGVRPGVQWTSRLLRVVGEMLPQLSQRDLPQPQRLLTEMLSSQMDATGEFLVTACDIKTASQVAAAEGGGGDAAAAQPEGPAAASASSKAFVLAPSDLTRIISALASLHYQPSAALLDSLLTQSGTKLTLFTPSEMSQTLAALASFGFRPSDPWMASFLATSAPQLMRSKGAGVPSAATPPANTRTAPGAAAAAGPAAERTARLPLSRLPTAAPAAAPAAAQAAAEPSTQAAGRAHVVAATAVQAAVAGQEAQSAAAGAVPAHHQSEPPPQQQQQQELLATPSQAPHPSFTMGEPPSGVRTAGSASVFPAPDPTVQRGSSSSSSLDTSVRRSQRTGTALPTPHTCIDISPPRSQHCLLPTQLHAPSTSPTAPTPLPTFPTSPAPTTTLPSSAAPTAQSSSAAAGAAAPSAADRPSSPPPPPPPPSNMTSPPATIGSTPDPAGLAEIVVALAKLGVRPTPAWTSSYLAAVSVALPRFDAAALGGVVWGVAMLELPLPAGWWEAVLARVAQLLGQDLESRSEHPHPGRSRRF